MIKWLLPVLKNPYMFAFAAIVSLIALGGLWTHGYMTGRENIQIEILGQTLETSEERLEIANNRPDDTAFFDGLYNDKDW